VLRRAVVAAPEYPNPALALAALLVDQGHGKDADVVLDDFVGRLFKAPDLDTYALQAAADFYRKHNDLAKALALYLKGYKRDQITNQFLYADLAQLYEQMHNDAEAIRIDEQLLDYFQKAGSAFDLYTKSTRAELDRLRRKPKRH
jgi:tetratricopeptide (TPR) repeat protein